MSSGDKDLGAGSFIFLGGDPRKQRGESRESRTEKEEKPPKWRENEYTVIAVGDWGLILLGTLERRYAPSHLPRVGG